VFAAGIGLLGAHRRAAKALGITMPQAVMLRADRVIE
jgi:hypothetical protein